MINSDDRCRQWSADKVREYVLMLVDHILQLASETDPSKGADSESGKDLKVWKALVHMREISETIAGWAIHHQTGLALNGLKHVNPASSVELRENPEYSEYLAQLNSHDNELAGRTVEERELNADVAQKILINCLLPNPSGISKPLSDKLVSALTALEFGEHLELFRAHSPYRKVRWEELQHQLRAVTLIEYRCRCGSTKHSAQGKVADKYGVSPGAIRRWESAVRKELGNLVVAQALESAGNAASLEQDAERGIPGSTPKGYWDQMYGEAALKLAGSDYLTFKKNYHI